MILGPSALPSDLAAALAALQAEREARLRVEAERDLAQLQATDWRAAAANARAEAANARAKLSDNEALIAHLKLRIEKLKRELYGQRSERTARLVDQLELNSKTSMPPRPRTNSRRRRRPPRRAMFAPSRASGPSPQHRPRRHRARARGASMRRRLAHAAAASACASSAKT